MNEEKKLCGLYLWTNVNKMDSKKGKLNKR